MKIIAISDHTFDNNLLKKYLKDEIKFIFLLGDLKYIDLLELKDVNIPIIGIYGNHCKGDYFKNLNAFNVHDNIYNNNIKITGIKGCPPYKGGNHEISENQAKQILQNKEKVDILISHSPGKGINNTNKNPHEGFKAITDYIDKNEPALFMHGHSYPPNKQKISIYKNTLCYYVEGLEIIDLNNLYENFNQYPNASSY